MNRIARRTGITLLLCVLLMAGFVFFLCEFVFSAGEWVTFSGSPHVYSGGNIGCGVVVDQAGILLLDMNEGRTYTADTALRKAMVHWLGDRRGSVSAPALSHYSSQIAGFDLMNGVYNYAQTGGVAELTLDAAVQKAALEAMGNQKGTVAVYNYKTGALLCAVTTPTYDPDNIPDIDGDTTGAYEGVYLNRFIQSAYIPGSIFKIVTLAAALETIPDIQTQKFVCTGTYEIGADKVTCEGAHWEQDLKTAFCNSCNCAFAQIAEKLGSQTLARYAEQFQITQSLSFDGITTSEGNFEVLDADPVNVAWSAIGQYKDQINPCRYMTFVGAIAAGGRGAEPYLVREITVEKTRTYSAKTRTGSRLMSESTAAVIREYLQNNVASKYGSENFPGLTVCAKTGTAEVGGDKKPNAMFTGFVADEKYPLAFIVAVEDGGYGRTVCVPIAARVLAACKAAIDRG